MSYASMVFPRFMQIAAQGVRLTHQDYTRTDLARNRFAKTLLGSEFTHILMLDVDHIHPVDIVQRLARWVLIDPEKLVIGGLNFRRSKPHEPCCFVFDNLGNLAAPAVWDKGLMEMDYIGTGSILIAREVFETIKPPWFTHVYDEELVMMDTWPGEDIGFNNKCREAGIKMYVDTTTTSPHCTDALVTEKSFRKHLEENPDQYKEVNEQGNFVDSVDPNVRHFKQ